MRDRQTCAHEAFEGNNAVNRMTDTGQFMFDVTIRCSQCGLPFQFIGLALGLDLSGAAMSVDGLTAHLTIVPQGSSPHPLSGVHGFTMKTPKQELDS